MENQQYEEYFEENSDNELEVEHEEVVVNVVVPQPIDIPLEVVVPGVAHNPESPSPSPPSSPEPSPAVSPAASPGPGSPQPQFGDAPSFKGFFTADDITELEHWAVAPKVSGVLQTYVWRNRRFRPTLRHSSNSCGATSGS